MNLSNRRSRRDIAGSHAMKTAVLAALLALSHGALGQSANQRLSDWLLKNPPAPDDYALGLSWRVPGEVPPQQGILLELLGELSDPKREGASAESANRLSGWLR